MDQEWADAINEEYGTEVEAVKDIDEEIEEEERDDDDTSKTDDDAADDSKEDDEEVEEGADDDDASDDAADDKSDDDADESGDAAKKTDEEEVAEKHTTKDDIKEALREMEQEKELSAENRNELRSEVIKEMFPDGIDKKLYDSAGDEIKGIDDVTKLINPKTGDYFTDEEAAQWLMDSNKKLNDDVAQLEAYADEIVDTNISLKDGADRVAELYGDVLEQFPEVADKLLDAYSRTLQKDEKTGIITKAPVDVVEFYAMALAPYKELAPQLAAQKQAEAKAKADKEAADKAAAEAEAKRKQGERGDMKQRGKGEHKPSGEDAEWLDAMEEYFNGDN